MDDVSVILYASHYDAIRNLSNDEKGLLLDAVFAYARGEQPRFSVTDSEGLKMAFSFIKIQMDIDKRKYKEKCERNKANARMRWQRTDADANDRIHNDNDNNNKNENENGKDNENNHGNDLSISKQKKVSKKEEPKKFSEEEKRQIKDVVSLFNKTMSGTEGCRIKGIRAISAARCEKIMHIVRNWTMETISATFASMAKSDYLNARTNELKRAADADWLLESGNFVKALEGSI